MAAGRGAADFLQRTDQQFHWQNQGYDSFDDFLADLSSSKRKNIRKERAAVREAGVTFEWLTGRDLTESAWDAFFACYIATGSRKWDPPYLTREFFSRVGASDGRTDSSGHGAARRRVRSAARSTFSTAACSTAATGAASTSSPFLHFEACYYQAIDFAIARGIARVEAGAQGQHKLLRGYLPSADLFRALHRPSGPAPRRRRLPRPRTRRVAEHMEELAELAPFRKST